MDALAVPDIDQLLQQDGSLQLADSSKWAEAASKVNMILNLQTSEDLAQTLPDVPAKLEKIQQKQVQLGKNTLAALMKMLQQVLPKAIESVAAVLLCQNMDLVNVNSAEWVARADEIQKLVDINLTLRISFDVLGVLGAAVGKNFKDQIEHMTKLFSVCAAMALWMIHGI